ncbi:unnamed protein product [Brugia pahangi]|uniref:ShKT domain-containing protein n=1 Tax=Brugia pahangi TaxID=6280 RepID=A0A0N4TE65_BRUPA|nr:unnamed protein product [Brugia pahangi]
MQQYCRAACHICNSTFNTTNECSDRHIACRQWSIDGQCRGDSDQFMEENCRQSCHFCNTPKNTSCPIPKPIRSRLHASIINVEVPIIIVTNDSSNALTEISSRETLKKS